MIETMRRIMTADKPEDPEILDLAMARASSFVSVNLSSYLIPSLKRIGKSWKCKTFSETIARMIDNIENGDSSSISSLGDQISKLITLHLDAGTPLPGIVNLLNKKGLVTYNGEVWTVDKLVIYCKYHNIDYQ